jgi:hypothetical protein
MPSWPTQSDYKDALQNPDTAFREPDLQTSQAERSPMGVPRARSGAFASVYKMSRGTKALALKLFNFPNEDRAGRYQAVSDYLKQLGAKKPAAMVGFEYHAEGIRVGKGWYPTLTMEWVKGKTLGEWVREAMERRVPDVAAVRVMADAWVRLMDEMQAAEIAHGDLQHDNVMVVGNQLVLVDYDGMCVPALAPSDPRKRLEQLEFGKPAYQHPARANQKLGLHLDHFAAWIILIALRASAADPGLYARFVTRTANENLLFTPPDMQTPEKSALWPELLRCADEDVREWSRAIRDTLNKPYKPYEQIPHFTLDPFARLRRLVAVVPRDWTGIAAESDRLTKSGKTIPSDLRAAADPLGRIRELCGAAKKDFVAIAIEADALTRSGKAVPSELKAIALDAVKRVNCRDAVQKALDGKNPRAVKTAFLKPLLEGWADRRLITDCETAVAQVEVLDKLKAAVKEPGDGRALVKLWAADGFRVAGIPEAEEYRAEIDRWQGRITAADAFLKLYAGKPTEQQLADAWQRVTAIGRHPAIERDHEIRGEQALRRAPVLARLARVPDTASYASDAALLAAWGDGSALTGCAEATPYSARVNTARDRINKVAALKRAIDAADAGSGTEAAVVEAAKPLARYDHPYLARVALGDKSVKVLAALQAAVDEVPPSDRRIAAVVDELRATNVELLARLDKVNPKLAAEATAAGRRRKALNEFAEIARKYPEPDKQDQKWQKLWTKYRDLLHKRRDTEELRERLTLAVDRSRAWGELAQALDARDMFQIRKLHERYGTLLRGYPPLVARQAEVGELLAKAERVIAIQDKLKSPDGVLSEDDLRFLRENHSAFGADARKAIIERITARLNSEARLVAGYPPVRVIPNGKMPTVAATWAWAGHGMVSHCLVAVDRNKHLTSPGEADQYGLLPCRIEDHTRDGGGKRVLAPPGAHEVYVTVWAVVELGWTKVYGPPLHLGPATVGQLQQVV